MAVAAAASLPSSFTSMKDRWMALFSRTSSAYPEKRKDKF
jgi:hypothetical protein